MSSRSYKSAIDDLNTLQSNAATLEAVRASGGRLSNFAIPEMVEYLERIGYGTEDLNKLNVIHITGTKGKGSTSAFTESILRHIRPDWKIGLYISPHLVAVRERIRINGISLSEEEFTKFFYEVWDRLEKNQNEKTNAQKPKPGYFRFLTLVAYHTFLSMKVNATILEVGVGGRYDSTNIVPKPVTTGITALGIDHISVLGKTLKDIAWQKGGIYKEGVPALTVNQPEEGMLVLRQQAEELKASEFRVVALIPGLSDVKLGLAGPHQIQNANLAIHLTQTFLREQEGIVPDSNLPREFILGLERTKWPGRCQTVADPKHLHTTWFLDGAHTIESLDFCMQWFVSPEVGIRPKEIRKRLSRVLIFNCTNGRSGASFLGTVKARTLAQLQLHGQEEDIERFFDHVVFCTNVTYADGGFKGDLTTFAIPESDLAQLRTQRDLASAWSSLLPSFPTSNIYVVPSIEHAVNIVHGLDSLAGKDVLVAGSLLLVGGVIEVAGLAQVAL